MKPDHEYSLRLKSEADILKTLKHPNIIGFRSYTKSSEGNPCLIMEAGEKSLDSIIEKAADQDKTKPLPARQILKVNI